MIDLLVFSPLALWNRILTCVYIICYLFNISIYKDTKNAEISVARCSSHILAISFKQEEKPQREEHRAIILRCRIVYMSALDAVLTSVNP